MKEDEILARVGAHVREERKDDAAFERVARGEAPADGGIDADLEAARPLGDAAIERIASRVAPAPGKPARVIPFVRRAATYAAPLALAAAVVLFVATRGGSGGPELPGYALTASGEQAMRGDTAPSSRLHVGRAAGSRFELVARPASAVTPDAKVIAYVFAMEDAEPAPLDANVDVSKDGAVRVTGDARSLGRATELRIVIGTPESIEKFEGALARAKSGASAADVRVLSVEIDRDR